MNRAFTFGMKVGVIGCCVVALCSGTVLAQSGDPMKDAAEKAKKALEGAKKDAKDAMGQPPAMDEKAMQQAQEAWEKAATPGAEHAEFDKMNGKWNCKIKNMYPGMPSEETDGTMVMSTIFEGRYQMGEFKGSMMGMPFDGKMMTGYNNASGQYESVWIDSMSTMMMMTKGKKESGNVVMRGEFMDPSTKKMTKSKDVTRWIDQNTFVMDFYHETDGKEMQVMSITYTRDGAKTDAAKPADKSAMEKAKQDAMKKAEEEAKKLKDKMPGR